MISKCANPSCSPRLIFGREGCSGSPSNLPSATARRIHILCSTSGSVEIATRHTCWNTRRIRVSESGLNSKGCPTLCLASSYRPLKRYGKTNAPIHVHGEIVPSPA
jgi:hypothetical protein